MVFHNLVHLKCFIYQKICPPTCHREERVLSLLCGMAALQWHQDSVLLTGAAIVSPLHKSSHGDRRWSSSHSAHPRQADLRAGTFPQAPTHTKRGGGAVSSTIEVTGACATLVLSSYSIYSMSIVDHSHQRREGRGDGGCVSVLHREGSRHDLTGP